MNDDLCSNCKRKLMCPVSKNPPIEVTGGTVSFPLDNQKPEELPRSVDYTYKVEFTRKIVECKARKPY